MESGAHGSETAAVVGGSQISSNANNRRRLLIYVAIFAIIGIVAIIVSNALTPSNGDFEAETMTVEAL